jgi:exosortase
MASQAAAHHARLEAQAVGAPTLSRSTMVVIGVLGALIVALFYEFLLRQHRFSINRPNDWGHAYLVPLISLYALWRNREAIARIKPERFWPGLIPLLVGIATYYFFTINAAFMNHMFQGFGLVLAIFGLCLLLLGPRMIVPLAFPIGYLLLGMTISEQVMNKTTFLLQQIAAQGAWGLLNIMGLMTDIIGNTLHITTSSGEVIPLNVAEACSGMRMVVAFIALGVAVAYFSTDQWWQRVVLLLLAVPVAVLTNVVRVASLGAASVISPDLAAGDAHALIGTLWLIPALLVYLSIGWALRKIGGQASGSGGKA